MDLGHLPALPFEYRSVVMETEMMKIYRGAREWQDDWRAGEPVASQGTRTDKPSGGSVPASPLSRSLLRMLILSHPM